MAIEHRKRVRISQHAMHRLRERVGDYGYYQSWEHFVRSARYNGRGILMMSPLEREWFDTHLHRLLKNSQIRLFNGFSFIFRGMNSKSWTLITVIPIFEDITEDESILSELQTGGKNDCAE